MLTKTMHCLVSVLIRPIWTVLCAFSPVSHLTGSLEYALCSSNSQSPSLPVKIAQIFKSVTQVCCISVLKLIWFSTDSSLVMSVDLSPGIRGVHQSLISTCTMASKRAGSKVTIKSVTRDVVKQVSMRLLIYEDMKMFIDKEIKMKWQEINEIFSCTFDDNMEDP